MDFKDMTLNELNTMLRACDEAMMERLVALLKDITITPDNSTEVLAKLTADFWVYPEYVIEARLAHERENQFIARGWGEQAWHKKALRQWRAQEKAALRGHKIDKIKIDERGQFNGENGE